MAPAVKKAPSANELSYINAAKALGIYHEKSVRSRESLSAIANKLPRRSAKIVREVPSKAFFTTDEFGDKVLDILSMNPYELAIKRAEITMCRSEYKNPNDIRFPNFKSLQCDFVIIMKTETGRIRYIVHELNGFFHENNLGDRKFAEQLLTDACKELLFKNSGIRLRWTPCRGPVWTKEAFISEIRDMLSEDGITY